MEAVDLGVDLDPVAGGDHGGLGDVLAGGGVGDQLLHAVVVERDPLEQRDRRGVVGDADHQDAHRIRDLDLARSALSCALRCSW